MLTNIIAKFIMTLASTNIKLNMKLLWDFGKRKAGLIL